ncbi:hypothetical protein ACG9ZL_16350 [Acinetobacter sp. ULE_I057]|uniref:hypothetical protein n=1 Tax=Acinetobacter sp. ULE_I057 TaxID=3373070 RepID=UPI003AF6C532
MNQTKQCIWTEVPGGNWWTDCDNGFVFTEISSPTEHEFKFCCFCDGELIEEKEEG